MPSTSTYKVTLTIRDDRPGRARASFKQYVFGILNKITFVTEGMTLMDYDVAEVVE